MAALQGTILASKIVPTDSLDTYATHEDKYGRGGHRSVDTIVERDGISPERRKEGMTVYVKSTKVKYVLEGGLTNEFWLPEASGGSIDLSNYYKKLETYSKAQVDALVAGGGADLSDYYKKAEVESLISAIPATDLTNYYDKTQVDSLIPNISTKQDTLVSATNIKTINGESVLGSGDIVISSGGVGQSNTDSYQGAYGISWDYATDTYIRTGAKGYTSIQSKMRRCVLNTNGTVKYYLHKDNSNFKENGTPSILTGADGNVMVEIPKHYIKTETVGNVDSMSISLTPEPGYVLDPAFLKWNGTAMVEVPYRYFRAYEGFVSNGKLLSISGVTPTRSQTIATFRTQAMANGTGWHLTDWNLLNTIKRLCYIEFCDFIVTKYLGNGNDTGNDYGITTGQSNTLGNRSSNSTHNNMHMSYRGIENLYADIWEFVDGVNVNNYQFYVNGKYSTFQSDIFTGDYVLKGSTTGAASNSLIKRCAASANMGFIPTVFGGSTTTFYGDAFWSSTGARIVFYSGSANNGASGGPGALNVNNASSYSDPNIGAAVCI